MVMNPMDWFSYIISHFPAPANRVEPGVVVALLGPAHAGLGSVGVHVRGRVVEGTSLAAVVAGAEAGGALGLGDEPMVLAGCFSV